MNNTQPGTSRPIDPVTSHLGDNLLSVVTAGLSTIFPAGIINAFQFVHQPEYRMILYAVSTFAFVLLMAILQSQRKTMIEKEFKYHRLERTHNPALDLPTPTRHLWINLSLLIVFSVLALVTILSAYINDLVTTPVGINIKPIEVTSQQTMELFYTGIGLFMVVWTIFWIDAYLHLRAMRKKYIL